MPQPERLPTPPVRADIAFGPEETITFADLAIGDFVITVHQVRGLDARTVKSGVVAIIPSTETLRVRSGHAHQRRTEVPSLIVSFATRGVRPVDRPPETRVTVRRRLDHGEDNP